MREALRIGDVKITVPLAKRLFSIEAGLRFYTTVNSDFVVRARRDKRFRRVVNSSNSTVDGQLVYYLLRLRHPFVRFEKIPGCELVYSFAKYAQLHGLRVFLLGGGVESNSGAIERLRSDLAIQVDGYTPGFVTYPISPECGRRIRLAIAGYRPDILLVGFGTPRQEFWIDDSREFLRAIGVSYVMGCGGSFDVVSGRVKRAPRALQRLCLEGVYRLVKEPRLFRLKRLLTSLGVVGCMLSRKPRSEDGEMTLSRRTAPASGGPT